MELLIKLWVISLWVVGAIGYYMAYKVERDHMAGVFGLIVLPILYWIVCFVLYVTYCVLFS